MEQLAIAFTGAFAVYLSQDKSPKARKFACIFGLIGQPFWFYTTYTNEQWGIFALCFFYTYSWLKGFKNNWLTTKAKKASGSSVLNTLLIMAMCGGIFWLVQVKGVLS